MAEEIFNAGLMLTRHATKSRFSDVTFTPPIFKILVGRQKEDLRLNLESCNF